MKHRFHLAKEIRERLESFGTVKEEKKEPVPVVVTEEKTEPQPETEPAEEVKEQAPFEVAFRTDIGKVRQTNQDALIVGDKLYGVADGMGGHKGGEVASAGLRDSLLSQLKDKEPDALALRNAILAANRRLFLRAQENEDLRGMGTTLDVLWVGAKEVYIGHVGDSRIYRLRDGELKQMTEDHSMVMEMVRAGMISEEQAAVHPMRNIITRAVGTENGVDIDLLTEDRKAGDLWLICSDGLHGLVKKDVMQDLMTRYAPEQAADELLAAALRAGGHDNISLVLLKDREGAQ